MKEHYYMTDDNFVAQFQSTLLHPNLFTHEAHLRLAWIYLNKYGIDAALKKICVDINRYAASQGAFDKFNKTLTIASTRAVYHFMLKSKSNNFGDFIAEFPRLKHNFKALIDAHYGFDIFNTEKAKKEYLPPDLLPFD